MSLDKILVSEWDLAGTYKTGLRDKRDYEVVSELYEKGFNYKQISDKTWREASVVSNWIRGKFQPQYMKGERAASLLDLLPLRIDNERFSSLNLLAAWTFWIGTLSDDYCISISGSEKQLIFLKEYFYKNLLAPSKIYEGEREGLFLRFGENGYIYGRILHALGIPNEKRKTQIKLKLPKYVSYLLKDKNEMHLKEFAKVLFETRVGKRSRHIIGVDLIANRKREYAEEFGEEIFNFLTKIYGLSEKEISLHIIKHQNINLWVPRISFRVNGLEIF